MENAKGIKQIGPYSYLYSNINEIIYNICLNQSENSIYFRFVKMRMTSVFMYEGKISKEEVKSLIMNKGIMMNNGSDVIIKEIGMIVLNQNFTIKEEKDMLRLTIVFRKDDYNNKERMKVIELRQVTDDNNGGKGNDYMMIIEKLSEIIDKQNVTIDRLEKNEGELLNRITNLEKINRIISDNVVQFKQKLNELQNPQPFYQSHQQSPSQQQPQYPQQQPQYPQQQPQYPQQQPQYPQPQSFFPPSNSDSHQQSYPTFPSSSKPNIVPNSAPLKTHKKDISQALPFNPYTLPFQIEQNNSQYDYSLLINGTTQLIKSKNELELIYNWISTSRKVKLTLLYKGTKCNFSPKQFHLNCNQALSTITIIESITGCRFGGYTTQTWQGEECYKRDYNAFLFSLDKLSKFPIKPEAAEYAIYCRSNNLVIFGNGYDICILDQSKNYQSLSQFPISYGTGRDNKWSLTGGLKSFNINEIETFLVELL